MAMERSGYAFMSAAEMTLIRAMIEPMERSIPPPMTTIACPTAASASGSTALARLWMPGGP